jgi:DNA-binding NarL/FixJ family response regulator
MHPALEMKRTEPQGRTSDDLDDALLRHPAFAAVLEAIPTAAFVVDARGAVACTNACGRAATQADEEAVRAALAGAVRGDPGVPSFVLRKMGGQGSRARYLAVMTTAGVEGPRARVRVLAQRWGLTGRQGEVLAELARGHCNKDVAARLGCAEVTVELHVTALLRKAGVESRAALIARFWTDGAS